MRTEDEGELIAAAEAIADGAEVDWNAQRARTPDLASRVETLQQLEGLAGAWRALGGEVAAGEDERAVLFRWGDLEALEKIGEGGFGEVFRAFDPALRREVALKLRRTDGRANPRRDLEEARRLARVRHPNVLAIHGVDVRDERAGLWTDLVHGSTLEQLLGERGAFGAEEAALIGLDLCRALAAVHAAGLTHGDVKTANVMREGAAGRGGASGSGRIVLMDFGSGRESGGDATRLTGTPLTAAPEVLRGQPQTPAADLYSLGVLLYRLTTGRYPVQAGSLEQLLAKHARGERESLRAARPDLPSPFVRAVERALEPDPAQRYADAGAMEAALGAALSAAPEPRVAERHSAPRRGLQFAMAAIAAVALLVVAAVLWAPQLRRTPATAVTPPQNAPSTATPPGTGTAFSRPPDAGAPGPAGTSTPPVVASGPAMVMPIVDAVLFRSRGGAEEALSGGALVQPGDHLFLEFEGREPLYVYVLNEDEAGEVFALFPVAGTDEANPLPAGERRRLPGARAGTAFDWQVTSAGGREHLLVIAARAPLAPLEKTIAALAPAANGREVRYAPVREEALATLRGIGGLAQSPATTSRRGKLDDLARSLAANREAAMWMRRYELENPTR